MDEMAKRRYYILLHFLGVRYKTMLVANSARFNFEDVVITPRYPLVATPRPWLRRSAVDNLQFRA